MEQCCAQTCSTPSPGWKAFLLLLSLRSNEVMPRSCAGPGQALLSQLQMPRSLSSSQQAQPDSRQHPPDGRGLNSSLSSMPFFDPVILSATSSSLLDRGGSHKSHLLSAPPAGALANACILPAELPMCEVVTCELCFTSICSGLHDPATKSAIPHISMLPVHTHPLTPIN